MVLVNHGIRLHTLSLAGVTLSDEDTSLLDEGFVSHFKSSNRTYLPSKGAQFVRVRRYDDTEPLSHRLIVEMQRNLTERFCFWSNVFVACRVQSK